MVEILRELGNLAEKGPIVISLISFGAFLLLIKWMLPIIRDSTASNTKLSESIDRLADTDAEMKTEILRVGGKIDDVHNEIGTIQDQVDDHEVRIVRVEEHIHE